MARILSYGSLNVDFEYHLPHFVAPGETLSSTSRELNCGGKGLNQSIAAARAGGTVFHAGKVGSDGVFLVDTLMDSGVNTSLISVRNGPSGHAIIPLAPTGKNCIILYGGSNQEIACDEVDDALEQFSAGDFLIIQNEIDCLDQIMKHAANKRVVIGLDP